MRIIRNWWATALPVLLSLSACAPTSDRAQDGIVSTSLCGDSYLLASGQPTAALSWQSDGPLGSGWTGLKADTDTERLVALQPATLLLGPGDAIRPDILPATHVIRLDWAEDWDGVVANMQKLSPAHDLAPASFPVRGDVSILYLSPAGGTAGPGTYVDTAIRLAGGRNIVTEPGWFTPDPEWILAQDPDIILTSFFDAYASVNAPVARHSALQRFVAARPRIDVPGRLWPCAGPGLAGAVELLSEGLGKL